MPKVWVQAMLIQSSSRPVVPSPVDGKPMASAKWQGVDGELLLLWRGPWGRRFFDSGVGRSEILDMILMTFDEDVLVLCSVDDI